MVAKRPRGTSPRIIHDQQFPRQQGFNFFNILHLIGLFVLAVGVAGHYTCPRVVSLVGVQYYS